MSTASARSSPLTDIGLAVVVVAVIVMIALPLPAWSLDVLNALSIFSGVVMLLVALFIPSPLSFSSFPAVLLITTLFRISLSVATTRQILLNGDAGDIIDAFGRLVVGGSLIVGLVVFLIITVVQFIVIAKGAERVAEVVARFTLDALPGKQMAIDADVRAGALSQAEAVARRQELVLESQFYGSMDGAMKFVKGDAIAGIVIVMVNLLGGIAIGMLVQDMSAAQAVHKYSILSIGDGLVSQIPALFVAIAAGIAITRTAPDQTAHLGDQILQQVSAHPRALMLAAGVMALFSLVPGFPAWVFLSIAAGTALLASALMGLQRTQGATVAQKALPAASREGETAPEQLHPSRPPQRPASAFRLELHDAALQRFDVAALNAALAAERQRLREHYGLPFPGLQIVRETSLPEGTVRVLVQDLTDAETVIPADAMLALAHEGHPALAQLEPLAQEAPALLAPARWVPAAQAAAWREHSVELLEPAWVVARLAVGVIQRHPASVLGVQGVRLILRDIEWRFGDLTREALSVLPIGRFSDLTVALARERVPLTDFPGLLQAVVSHAPGTKEAHVLYEAVRLALARSIVARLLPPAEKTLAVLRLDAPSEARLRSALVTTADGPSLGLEPAQIESLTRSIEASLRACAPRTVGTLLVPADLRRASSRLLRGPLPLLACLSAEELAAAAVAAETVATVSLEASR